MKLIDEPSKSTVCANGQTGLAAPEILQQQNKSCGFSAFCVITFFIEFTFFKVAIQQGWIFYLLFLNTQVFYKYKE